MEDSTFRAFMRDPNFLQTILPISNGLNCILQRIFEVDPKRRITLDALRDFILFCPQLSQESMDSLPPTPPYSPVEKPIDAPMVPFTNGLEPVPNLDLNQHYSLFPTVQFNTPQPSLAPMNIPTPPTTTGSSYTYQTKRTTRPVGSPFANQAGFLPSIPSWSRCSHLVPNLAQNACWKNVSVF